MAINQLQNIIYGLSEASESVIGVLDKNLSIIACSGDASAAPKNLPKDFIDFNEAVQLSGWTFAPIKTYGEETEFIVFVKGDDIGALKTAKLSAVSLSGILSLLGGQEDVTNFIKNVMLENIMPGDVYAKSRELHVANDNNLVVLVVKADNSADISLLDIVKTLFPEHKKNILFNLSENTVVLAKEVNEETTEEEIINLASSIVDTLSGEFYISAFVGIGTIVGNIKDLSRSFKEAQIALEVGKVFDDEKHIITYTSLGIGRLIYQLPTTLCEAFLTEIFENGSIDTIDQETLFTIQKFFENSLNVSETSRKLFVHRNTLVYRLDKVKKITGLDLREFDDAIVFKISTMVKKYLNSSPTHL
jgi:Regulator of polyketide synthase expression